MAKLREEPIKLRQKIRYLTMKKYIITFIISVTILSIGYVFISGDTENRFARLGVTYFDGNYVITHYGHSATNVWLVLNGKVTSEPDKGYYHTRVLLNNNKTAYLQLPIRNTVIEEYFNQEQLTTEQRKVLTQKYAQRFTQ